MRFRQFLMFALAATIIFLSGCAAQQNTETPAPPNPAADRVSASLMPAYCKGEAAAKFGQRIEDVSTQPAQPDQGMYSVFGQFPPSGADPTVFICTFNSHGELVGIDQT